jgi:hypothetical protein
MIHICPFTKINLTRSNLEKWEKTFKYPSTVISKRLLNYFEVSDISEYIKIIKDNIDNLDDIFEKYEVNKQIAIENEEKQEKLIYASLMKKSIYKISNKIIIRMLNPKDKINAYTLYKKFKDIIGDEYDDDYIISNIDDFILKNKIYGIFSHSILIGIMILDIKYFKIDTSGSRKVKTFYIQEIIITENGKGYGNKLIEYAINICPISIKYISFMTTSDNLIMHKIGLKYGFIKQDITSGDIKHSSLFIKSL